MVPGGIRAQRSRNSSAILCIISLSLLTQTAEDTTIANTLKKLAQLQLGTADGVIYTAPALTRTTITAIYKSNTTAADRTFRLHQVNSGGSSTAANALYFDEPIVANRVHPRIDSAIILEPGQMLRGLASVVTAITISVFGIESTEAG